MRAGVLNMRLDSASKGITQSHPPVFLDWFLWHHATCERSSRLTTCSLLGSTLCSLRLRCWLGLRLLRLGLSFLRRLSLGFLRQLGLSFALSFPAFFWQDASWDRESPKHCHCHAHYGPHPLPFCASCRQGLGRP